MNLKRITAQLRTKIQYCPHLLTIEWELLVGETFRLGVPPLTEGGVSDSVGVTSVEDWRR